MDCVICRYGELALKGKNRYLFEQKLLDNIHDCLVKNRLQGVVKKVRGRIFVFTSNKRALECLQRVFGLVSISPAVICPADPGDILDKTVEYVENIYRPVGLYGNDSRNMIKFRVTTRRVNKCFPKTSNEMDVLLGDAIVKKFDFKVDLKNYDLNIGVEIHQDAFIFHEVLPCHGGLPLGMSGKVACLIGDDAGIASAWLMMRRGCDVFALILQDRAENQTDIIGPLYGYSYGSEIQSEVLHGEMGSQGLAGKISELVVEKSCKALVVGDTLERFDPAVFANVRIPVLTPLIAYSEQQIEALVSKINNGHGSTIYNKG